MVVVDVLPNGQAPKGLSVGDFVNTAGGMYQIAPAGAYGATYNPTSGYWSYNTNSDGYRIQSLINSAQSQAQQNTMTSQQFAREQMAFQNNSANRAMDFSAQQAQLQRDWQESMSNTAHQREVQDLIAAGLNPILSANTSGATTPSGASASGVAASGAQGSVDTGSTSSLTQLLTTMLNNQNALDITKLTTAASMYTAEMAANASIYGSNMSSSASRYASDQSFLSNKYTQYAQHLLQEDAQEHAKYMAQNYPSNSQLLGSALGELSYTITQLFNYDARRNGKDFAQSIDDWRAINKAINDSAWNDNLGYKGNLIQMAYDIGGSEKMSSFLRGIKALHEGNYLK